ncbi:MAG: transcription termination/antitermination protein NusG, partial [Oscillospiraceae bacterium]|nr:transcription termination/antitermination protein NusG [Oscillospiraceae bacterium]
PTPLSEKEVAAMGINSRPAIEVDYSVGDIIRVTGTTMDGFTGIVKSIDLEHEQVEVLVSMFGRETPTTVALHQAVRLDD